MSLTILIVNKLEHVLVFHALDPLYSMHARYKGISTCGCITCVESVGVVFGLV